MGGFFREMLTELLVGCKVNGTEIFLDSEHNLLNN